MATSEYRAFEMAERLSASQHIKPVLENLLQVIPEQGCVQGCNHCSQEAKAGIRRVGIDDVETMLGAFGILYNQTGIDNSFNEIYSYKDNDPGLYPWLDRLIAAAHANGLNPIRISTQGFSRSRDDLSAMHQRIISDPDIREGLGRVRISVTPGVPAYRTAEGRLEYESDIAHLLRIYNPLIGQTFNRSLGKGLEKEVARFGVFLRYPPDVKTAYFRHEPASVGGSYYIDEEYFSIIDETEFDTKLEGPDGSIHSLTKYNLQEFVPTTPFKLMTLDGDDPTSVRNFLWVPGSESAVTTDRVRYFTIARDKIRCSSGIEDDGRGATWRDVDAVIRELQRMADVSEHIRLHILPIASSLVSMYKQAGYSAETFFDRSITKDAGVLSNQGRESNRWSKVDSRCKPYLPATDREFDDLHSFVYGEGLAYAVAPTKLGAQVMKIGRIYFDHQDLGDPALLLDIDSTRLDNVAGSSARVGKIALRKAI